MLTLCVLLRISKNARGKSYFKIHRFTYFLTTLLYMQDILIQGREYL